MKKTYLLLATTAMVMAGCANEDFVGETPTVLSENQPIGFSMNMPNATRAKTAEESASDLGNEFIVWGEKNESGAAALNSGNVVFENYRVQYKASTANTTASNTKDWEYVGITPYHANGTAPATGDGDETTASVSPSMYSTTTPTQTIKYWDFGKPYTFTAVSALKSDITSGKVKITKNYGESSAAEKGYTIEVGTGATPGKIYVADRMTVTKSAASTSGAAADAVQLQFRNFQTKIRFGIYETIPGYKVVITGIKYNNATATSNKFGIEGNFIQPGANTKYKVTYVTSGDNDKYKAQVDIITQDSEGNTVTPAKQDYLQTEGTTWLTNTTGIGTASNAPTWDNADNNNKGEYTAIQPNTSNSTNLKLQIAYKLISEDTGEVIEFKETNNGTTTDVYRTVEVPAQYCQWKSNYAYTYLFKITDKSADLYPITFDAVVVESETGTQETTTSVSDPSITTFAVSGGKYVSNENEYAANDVIYATVLDGSAVAALTESNIKLYTVTSDDAAKYQITEANVANCLVNGKDTSTKDEKQCTDVNGLKLTVTPKTYTASTDLLNEVPSEDGNTVKLDTNGKALKWTAGTSGTYYAVEYTYTDSSSNTEKKVYKIVKIQ